MKKKILVLRCSILITFMLCYAFSKGSNQIDIDFELFLKKNMANNQITIYLNHKGTIKDSITLNNLNFVLDTLIKVKNNLWSYLYSVRCGSGCKLRKQILLQSENDKLRLTYVGYHSITYDHRDLYSSDRNINGSIAKLSYPIYNCFYSFSDSTTAKKLILKEYIYEGKNPDDGTKGTSSYYELKYDSLKNVYYTETYVLSGEYTILLPKDNKESKEKINTVVLALKFKEINWVYYKSIWYELNPSEKTLIKFE